jgi:hypothetical protein
MDTPIDAGVEWDRPVEVEIYNFIHDESNGSISMEIRLWDEDERVTKWDGILTVIVLDENLNEVYNETDAIKTRDFKMRTEFTEEKEWLDAYYHLVIPVKELNNPTDLDDLYSLYMWDVIARFEIGNEILERSQLWNEPVKIILQNVDASYSYDYFSIDFKLIQKGGLETKWNGNLRIIAVDSLEVEICNDTFPIQAIDFDVWTWYVRVHEIFDFGMEGVAEAECGIIIDYSPFNQSSCRNLPPQKRMITFKVWYEFDGKIIKQDTRKENNQAIEIPIPDKLIVQNQKPVAMFEGPSWCWEGGTLRFNASSSYDPDGYISSYMFTYGGGGTIYPSGLPSEVVTFQDIGIYTVTLSVYDSDDVRVNLTKEIEVRNGCIIVR